MKFSPFLVFFLFSFFLTAGRGEFIAEADQACKPMTF